MYWATVCSFRFPPAAGRFLCARESNVTNLRIWIVASWIALPTVMFEGFSFLRLITRQENRPSAGTPVTITRAGLPACSVVVLVYGLLV